MEKCLDLLTHRRADPRRPPANRVFASASENGISLLICQQKYSSGCEVRNIVIPNVRGTLKTDCTGQCLSRPEFQQLLIAIINRFSRQPLHCDCNLCTVVGSCGILCHRHYHILDNLLRFQNR